MSTQGTNEAAERLREGGYGTDLIGEAQYQRDLDAALAAERRATVERIRDWADKHERIGILSYPAAQRIRAILDEEAAR